MSKASFSMLAALAVCSVQTYVAQAGGVSDVNVDRAGRQAMCDWFDDYHRFAFEGDVRVRCEGKENEVFVESVEDPGRIWVGEIDLSVAVESLSERYDDTSYQYDRLTKSVSPPKTPAEEIIQRLRAAVPHYDPAFTRPVDTPMGERLKALGVVTIADIYAAAGFTKYLVRNARRDKTYLELSLSNQNYGKNPTVVKLIPKSAYPGTVRLFQGTGACGAGEFFSTVKGRYSEQRMAWLSTTLNFAYSGSEVESQGEMSITFETVADTKVSIGEMEALMLDQDFAIWVGPEVVDSLRALIEQRQYFYANAATVLQAGEQFSEHPIVKSYLASLRRLVALMKKKFDLIKWNDGTVC